MLSIYFIWILSYFKFFDLIEIGSGGKLKVCIIVFKENLLFLEII